MDKLKHVKGVFLDLGGTLLYPPSGNWNFSALARQYFPKELLEAPRAQAVVEDARRVLEENHLLSTTREELERYLVFYRSISQGLELNLSPEALYLVAEDKVFNKKDNYRLFDDTAETLKALYGKYRLGIISDTWPSIVPLLESFDILKYFDCVTYSFQLGAFKPDQRLYRDALSKMGLPAGETLFVDDRACNLEAAREAGIHPVLIQADSTLPPWEQSIPDGVPVIHRISGLLDILEEGE